MDRKVRKLSDYIDQLNAERRPVEHGSSKESPEMEELFETVRMVRSLREPVMPEGDFAGRLAAAVSSSLSRERSRKSSKKKWFYGIATAAAAAALIIAFNTVGPFVEPNMVQAMDQAFQQVGAYHGILEVVETNAEGESITQTKVEVWADKDGRYYVKGLEGWQKGLVTVNDGEKKWQIQPDEKEVELFSAFPDPYSFTFEIGKEIENVKNAVRTRILGNETVAGRETVVMEVTPQGGSPYKIWIDKETKMPLQKQSEMDYAIQYTVRYAEINFSKSIPDGLLAFSLPEGYKKVDNNLEHFVSSLEEARDLAGFVPRLPEELPDGYVQDSIAVMEKSKIVKINYTVKNKEKVSVLQKEATENFKPSSMAILGKVNGNTAEIQSPIQNNEAGILQGGGVYAGVTDISSIRWQQDGFEYAVFGNVSLDNLAAFAEELSGGPVEIPEPEKEAQNEPQVKVPVDLEIEKAEQKNVDAGHSPWMLDPAFVAQVFVSLEMSPGGIQGDYPIDYEELSIIENDGVRAIVEVHSDESPIKRVYLERLVRQDETGIWTVVGYDPAN